MIQVNFQNCNISKDTIETYIQEKPAIKIHLSFTNPKYRDKVKESLMQDSMKVYHITECVDNLEPKNAYALYAHDEKIAMLTQEHYACDDKSLKEILQAHYKKNNPEIKKIIRDFKRNLIRVANETCIAAGYTKEMLDELHYYMKKQEFDVEIDFAQVIQEAYERTSKALAKEQEREEPELEWER